MHKSPYTLIRITDVIKFTGYGRSSVYNLMTSSSSQYDPTFPKSVSLSHRGKGAVAWVLAEVEAWIEARIHAR